ncbi:hypothetical protein [Vibrio japonicus]|uniref:Uncharacterized protein n=1 Tax=Vibrio japonicus TaxID=1824638 RepID=A0ABY5LQQ6_9VIBR|nr:hypothetical protein [Vibrio japonicus]UUM33082.1 hypothetical protein NP165_16170 [Vibrio japonicus]
MTLISRLTITLALIMPIGAIASLEGIKPELGKNLTKEDIIVAYKSNPDIVLDILTILLRTENIDEQLTVQSAFEIAPERALEIAEIARVEGVSNELITTAALLAGVDPTQFSEATAAGIAPATAPESINAIAPPVAPAVGNNGGGHAVVSPN